MYGGVETLACKYLVAVKEGGEMIGAALFMRALLQYVSAGRGSVDVAVERVGHP